MKARTRILLDSNAYFRLAQSVHPLLDEEFGGEARYCLYVIPDLDREFTRSQRLQRKFHWVDSLEYRENRSRPLQVSAIQRKEIKEACDFMAHYARSEGLGTSPVDIRALATAYVLQVQIVTDDQDLLQLAEAFDVRALTTLALMRLMLDEDRIDMTRVRQTVEYWRFEKDLPARFRRDYERLFGEEPP